MTEIAAAQEHVSFPTPDGGLIHGDLCGKGDRAVILAHGLRFNNESWKKQAAELAKAGFRVLAIDFRGYGQSSGPGQSDPLSAPLNEVVSDPAVTENADRCKCLRTILGARA